MNEEILRIENAKVLQDKNHVLVDFYFYILQGEIQGLVYDNLNEMQCIADLLSGELRASSARIFFNEVKTNENKSAQVLKDQVKAITKKSKVFRNVTVKENLYAFTSQAGSLVLNMTTFEKSTKDLFKQFKIPIDPNKKVIDCSPYECSVLELMQAYLLKKKLVLIVNLSDFLSSIEIVQYINLIRILTTHGMSFVIFDFHVDFLIKYTDRLSIINEGRTVAILDSYECEPEKVYNILHHGTLLKENKDIACTLQDQSVLEFCNVVTRLFDHVSFSIKRGEVATVICMENESYHHFREILTEGYTLKSGRICLSGEPYVYRELSNTIKKGLVIIEENPTKTMLFNNHTALSNCCFNLMRKMSGPCITQNYENCIEDSIKEYFDEQDLLLPVSRLEPYKQQKLVYCKWLFYAPRLVICMKPFSSVDIHMLEVTKNMILEYSRRGISVLILTTNIADIYTFETKNIFIKDGKVIEENYLKNHLL